MENMMVTNEELEAIERDERIQKSVRAMATAILERRAGYGERRSHDMNSTMVATRSNVSPGLLSNARVVLRHFPDAAVDILSGRVSLHVAYVRCSSVDGGR